MTPVRELDSRHLVSRVKGRPALERRMRSLLLAVGRFANYRAFTSRDRRWAAAVVDRLQPLLRDDAPQRTGEGEGGDDQGL